MYTCRHSPHHHGLVGNVTAKYNVMYIHQLVELSGEVHKGVRQHHNGCHMQ